MKMYTIDEIKEALEGRVLLSVAEKTGIHSNTIYSIASGKRTGINFTTYMKLCEFLFPENKKAE